jgi:hypothetical protein
MCYAEIEKEILQKLGGLEVDMWERSPAYNQFVHILQEFEGFSKITPWVTGDSPFATNMGCISCLPFSQYKRLRKLQLDLKRFLNSAKQGFDEKIYGPVEQEEEDKS